MRQERPDDTSPEEPGDSSAELNDAVERAQTTDPTEQASLTVRARWRGPLPPPSQLVAYNDALPDAAERILTMTERAHAHHLQIQDKLVDNSYKLARNGQFLGLLVAIIILAFAAFVGYLGSTNVAGLIAVLDVAAVTAVFVYSGMGRQSKADSVNDHLEDDR